ncbi:MAG: hypothetical protein LBI48_01945 [Burkholderiaceae bacterium]|jgi:hypothetical protein|nr:hypothetical protein [Burkholderiaceae bacterium]
MGTHAIAKSVGLGAEYALKNRKPGQTALEILDMLCAPWRGCDAEWEAEDPQRPGYMHPEFYDYTDPHPKAALGMLMIEAFAPNGLADLPKYRTGTDEAEAAWWAEVYEPFKQRYDFCQIMDKDNYPAWVCADCGRKYGHRVPDVATWHEDTCGVCGKQTAVSEPRDFGHLRDDWVNERSVRSSDE